MFALGSFSDAIRYDSLLQKCIAQSEEKRRIKEKWEKEKERGLDQTEEMRA